MREKKIHIFKLYLQMWSNNIGHDLDYKIVQETIPMTTNLPRQIGYVDVLSQENMSLISHQEIVRILVIRTRGLEICTMKRTLFCFSKSFCRGGTKLLRTRSNNLWWWGITPLLVLILLPRSKISQSRDCIHQTAQLWHIYIYINTVKFCIMNVSTLQFSTLQWILLHNASTVRICPVPYCPVTIDLLLKSYHGKTKHPLQLN